MTIILIPPVAQNLRPEIPLLQQWSSHLAEIIRQCWALDPALRPPFQRLNNLMWTLRTQFGWNGREEVYQGEDLEERDWIDWIDELDRTQQSPPMDPNLPLPPLARTYSCASCIISLNSPFYSWSHRSGCTSIFRR